MKDKLYQNDPIREREDRKPKKKKKKKHNSFGNAGNGTPGIINKYNAMETKSNVNHSLIKTLVDFVGAAVVGPALSASLGKFAPIAGAALSFGGHYIGDESGLMRGIGMGTVAHSIAKTKEYREPDSTMKDRLSGLKDDWLRLIMMKKVDEPSINGIDGKVETDKAPKPTDIPAEFMPTENDLSFPEMDLTALDTFETQLHLSADDYENALSKRSDPVGAYPASSLDDQDEADENQSPTAYLDSFNDPDLPDDFDFSLI
jgi:hypothetical protein